MIRQMSNDHFLTRLACVCVCVCVAHNIPKHIKTKQNDIHILIYMFIISYLNY